VGGSSGKFETNTKTAVAGVRGTVYSVKAGEDNSSEFSVYEGQVGVGPPLIAQGAEKKEIAWPQEVSEAKWKEIVLSRLTRLKVGPDGKPGKPEPFDPAKEKDDWVKWNQERDKK
jgi:hypothetical protein